MLLAVKKEQHRSLTSTPAGASSSLYLSTTCWVGKTQQGRKEPCMQLASDSRRTASIDRRALAHTACNGDLIVIEHTRRRNWLVVERKLFLYGYTQRQTQCDARKAPAAYIYIYIYIYIYSFLPPASFFLITPDSRYSCLYISRFKAYMVR